MSNSKFKLDRSELDFAEKTLMGIHKMLEEIDRCKQFKVGDYLIGRRVDYNGKFSVVVQSSAYKTPEKFVVVYVNKDGIPFYKKLDVYGKEIGILTCCLVSQQLSVTRDVKFEGSEYYMELDPDYADAIILDSKDTFNPSLQRRQKVELYREITKYNKECKINTKDKVALEKFFKTLKNGDILYKSPQTFYTVQNTESMNRKQAQQKYGYKFDVDSVHHATKLTLVHVVDSKGKAKILSSALWEMQFSNLYNKKPRAYKELKDQ
jgi:hypothetical protein